MLIFSSHTKPVVLADRRQAQTDPAGRLEKCGLELSLKAVHLALENSVTKLYHDGTSVQAVLCVSKLLL